MKRNVRGWGCFKVKASGLLQEADDKSNVKPGSPGGVFSMLVETLHLGYKNLGSDTAACCDTEVHSSA